MNLNNLLSLSLFGLGVYCITLILVWFKWVTNGSLQKLYGYTPSETDILSMGIGFGIGIFLIIFFGQELLISKQHNSNNVKRNES